MINMKYFTLTVGLAQVLKIWGLKRPVYMTKCYKVVILFNLSIPKDVQSIGM